MKNIMKKGIIALVVIMLVFVMCSSANVFAAEWSGMITEVDGIEDSSNARESAKNIVGALLSVAKVVAVGIALIMLVVLAMKYMSAAPGDKAEIKKSATIYVTGAVILFGSAGILSIIETFASTNITNG